MGWGVLISMTTFVPCWIHEVLEILAKVVFLWFYPDPLPGICWDVPLRSRTWGLANHG